MRKVNLNMKCERQYRLIKAVVDGNMKAARSSVEFGMGIIKWTEKIRSVVKYS